jgi:hypothetical protein
LLILILGLGAGVLILWAAGFEPWAWWKAHQLTVAANATPSQSAPRGPISIVQPTPLGTDSSISKVPLALHLTATRLGRNTREGYADIGVNVLSPQTYKAGALLANGVRLEEIYSDYVLLTRDGQATRLYMDGRAQPASATPVAASMLTVGGTAPIPAARADSREALTEAVRVAPVFEGDRLHALELYPGGEPDRFAALGLKPGDRITAIEGKALTSAPESIEQLRHLSDGVALNVTIERSGERQSLYLDGSILKASSSRP